MKIFSKDISVVVQGTNVKKYTKRCFKSIRRFLPEATIIFSTYENENVSDLDYDILVTSKDPGAELMSGKWYNNINRILTTTKAGISKVKTKYCIKMRSDLIFDNAKVLDNIFEKFPVRDTNFAVFKNRVVFYQIWSRKYEYLNKNHIISPFHLSDWFVFGLTEDIVSFFDASPLTKEPEYTKHLQNPLNRIQGLYIPQACWKFPPEQYFTLNYFQKFFPEAAMKNYQDFSEEKSRYSEQVLANNVIMGGYKELGVYIQKGKYTRVSKKPKSGDWKKMRGIFTYEEFLKDYKKYCDSSFEIPLRYNWKTVFEIEELTEHLQKHYKAFIKPFKKVLSWSGQLFSIISYSLKIVLKISKNLNRIK